MYNEYRIPLKDITNLMPQAKLLYAKHGIRDKLTLDGESITLLMFFYVLYASGLTVAKTPPRLGEADLEIEMEELEEDDLYPLTNVRLKALTVDIGQRYSVCVNKRRLRNTLGFTVEDDDWEEWLTNNEYYHVWERWAISGFNVDKMPFTVLPTGYKLNEVSLSTHGEISAIT